MSEPQYKCFNCEAILPKKNMVCQCGCRGPHKLYRFGFAGVRQWSGLTPIAPDPPLAALEPEEYECNRYRAAVVGGGLYGANKC